MAGFTLVFIVALAIGTALQAWLLQRQIQTVRQNRPQVPPAFAEKISLGDHQKAADYSIAKARFGQIMLLLEAGLLLLWTLGGLLNWLDQSWQSQAWSPLWTGVAVLLSVLLLSSLLEVPVSYYRTFVLEAKFGFNRETQAIFFADLGKGLALSLAIGAPFILLVLWLMNSAGELWWLYTWLAWMGFSLFMLWAYPAFIAPLFNKFKALEDGDLKQRIESLLSRNGFISQGIFVMDGSKRSGHGNAYFTGLGGNKRIVFYDTLLERLNAEEVEAVLAHEVGHFKRKHIHKRLGMMALTSLGGLYLLAWLMQQNWFYQGLGVAEVSTHAALALFMFVLPVFSIFFTPLFSLLSRRHEFEADDFAASQADANTLIQALVKLYRENASTLTPDPLYSAFYDSHPPAPVRIKHLQALGSV